MRERQNCLRDFPVFILLSFPAIWINYSAGRWDFLALCILLHGCRCVPFQLLKCSFFHETLSKGIRFLAMKKEWIVTERLSLISIISFKQLPLHLNNYSRVNKIAEFCLHAASSHLTLDCKWLVLDWCQFLRTRKGLRFLWIPCNIRWEWWTDLGIKEAGALETGASGGASSKPNTRILQSKKQSALWTKQPNIFFITST